MHFANLSAILTITLLIATTTFLWYRSICFGWRIICAGFGVCVEEHLFKTVLMAIEKKKYKNENKLPNKIVVIEHR